ncbi:MULTISPECIES: hypothetical protein [Calothrix]|uniref:hypothetical protein n=1 Tax=Calothrix TaxID=1186 RepID=UPI0036F2E991
MEWTKLLVDQQNDFIQRLKSGHLLHCEIEGQNSELTVISGERLKKLRDFCWEMVKKYKPDDPKKYFINNLKGKLGEEVVKSRLTNFVTEVDYEKRIGGDGKIDFTLTSQPNIGIQVKARQGDINQVKWLISKEEVDKNAVLVCILIQEEVNESQNTYNLILSGFLPTNMIQFSEGNNFASYGIDELLYCGGLYSYLQSLIPSPRENVQSGSCESEITRYNSALETLISSIINQLLQHEDFIEKSQNIIVAEMIGQEATAYDRHDGLIDGYVTYYQPAQAFFKIEDGDFYTLEWTIAFKVTGTADIGYVTSDGEDGYNSVLAFCEGNVNIKFTDDFRDYFLLNDSIEEIIEDVFSSIEFQAEIDLISFD